MGKITQKDRSMSISHSALEKDTLLLFNFSGSDLISDLFEYQIEVLSHDLELKPEQIIGHLATITLNHKDKRYFNGYISHFEFGELNTTLNLRHYSLTMVPWLWFAGKTNNHRIFQEKNTKEIVTDIFSELGFSDFQFKAEGGKEREYCIQYNESDLHFVSRLLEEEGYAYYFKHDAKKHLLVIVDQINAYEDCVQSVVEYSPDDRSETQLHQWQHQYNFQKGQWIINDYNFKEPAKDLVKTTKTTSKFANNANYKHYEYPDLYDFNSKDDLVKIRMKAEEVAVNVVQSAGDCSSFYSGGKFKLVKHPSKSENGSYIIVGMNHSAQENSYLLGNSSTSLYTNSFSCIPAKVHFVPMRRHQRPVMQGPQSALVVGPKGEEIYIDEFGRIKVQFFWDRGGKKDENSTCFIRVVQSWAGNKWGSSFIPRMGHEVIVSFLDGNPDRPIVTGSVYNGKNKPVYGSKTQSGLKTRSTKGGTKDNYNELRFEDKKGDEQIYLHAERNFDVRVENDETLTVDKNRTKKVLGNENSTIEKDRNKTVNENQTESIKKNKTITVSENHTETIKKNKTLTVEANHEETVKKNMTINVDVDLKETVKGQYTEAVTKDYGLSAETITMTADKKIIIQTGSSKIIMKENGDIEIKGKKIKIDGSSKVSVTGKSVTHN